MTALILASIFWFPATPPASLTGDNALKISGQPISPFTGGDVKVVMPKINHPTWLSKEPISGEPAGYWLQAYNDKEPTGLYLIVGYDFTVLREIVTVSWKGNNTKAALAFGVFYQTYAKDWKKPKPN
jgi:hypothetical protein